MSAGGSKLAWWLDATGAIIVCILPHSMFSFTVTADGHTRSRPGSS